MRVLFSGVPALGHLLPMLPLAAAARDLGHETGLVTSATVAGAVAPLPVLPAGPPLPEMIARHPRRTGPGVDPADPVETTRFLAGTRVELTLDDAVAAARDFGPDLVVAEVLDAVGPAVAAALDVPWATYGVGPWAGRLTGLAPSDALLRAMSRNLAGPLAARGLTLRQRCAYVDPCPDVLHPADRVPPADRLPVRARPHAGPGGRWTPPAPGRRPRVLVSMGTVTLSITGAPGTLDTLVASLVAADLDVLVTLSWSGASLSPDHPADRVQAVGFVPLADLLPAVDAVVSVGGAGTVLGVLGAGLPLVLLPRMADQPFNAQCVAAAGAGTVIDEPGAAGAAARHVLAQPSFRAAARAVAAAMERMPAPHDVVRRLAALAARSTAGRPSAGLL